MRALADFAGYSAQEQAPTFLDRLPFRDLSPREAARRVVAHIAKHLDLRPVTLRQKERVLSLILSDLAQRGLNLGNVQPADATLYRQFLRNQVTERRISETYASHRVRVWNSCLRATFCPEIATPLAMRGFPQRVRQIEHLTETDMGQLLAAIDHVAFSTMHHREAFRTYLETAWSTGARIGSLLGVAAGDINWANRTLRLRHMKTKDGHTAILSMRASTQLQNWIDSLSQSPPWIGLGTKLLVTPKGRPLTGQWINWHLRRCAAAAGITKRVSTHVIRKSVGTIMARENPKLAQLQLGITSYVFNVHYNQPLLEDRLKRRDLLPHVAH